MILFMRSSLMEELHICVGVGKCEIESDDEKGEFIRKKEIIYIRNIHSINMSVE